MQKDSNHRSKAPTISMLSVISKTVCHDFATFILDVLQTTYLLTLENIVIQEANLVNCIVISS